MTGFPPDCNAAQQVRMTHMKTALPAFLFLTFFFAAPLSADQLVSNQAVLDRLEQLEAETRALRAQLQISNERIERLPAVTAMPAAFAPEPAEAEYFTLEELRGEMQEVAWTKGPFRIVPYGFLWGSAIYATARTSPGPYTFFVFSEDAQGEDAFEIDTRRTRLGLNIAGPGIPMLGCAASGGKVEIDFHGAFVIENKPGVLLRHAYGEIKNESFRLLAGQTWDVVSPLYPGTLNYSVGWGGGNIGYRRMQIRLERYLALTDRTMLTLQGSVNQNIVSDFQTASDVNPESSGWPLLQGRVAVTTDGFGPCALPMTCGISAHVGEQSFDFTDAPPADDFDVQTWSFNMDLRIPVTDRLGFQGEFFTGENLGTLLGGVVQGVNRTTRRGIQSTGGWCEVWYDITPRLHSHVGCGLDDPRNADVTAGRTYNDFVFINGIFDVTDKLSVGLEVTSWRTHYSTASPGDSVTFEFMGKYGF